MLKSDKDGGNDDDDDMNSINAASRSTWRSVRPWSSRFVLNIREITSVSATFILSSFLSSDNDPSLASLGLISSPEEENALEDVHFISETLGKGLSVYVNGAPWKRTLIRVDEESDEAIIILYGLIPGRQYDVVLGVMTCQGEERVQSTLSTQPQSSEQDSIHARNEAGEATDSSTAPLSIIHNGSTSSVCGSADASPMNTPPRPVTIEDRATQLRSQLSTLASERSSLATQLKTARKEAQKSDAALRSEIEVLKRASEKHAPVEHRSRQKVLALQEAVKQTIAATAETERRVRDMEAVVPELKRQEDAAQKEHAAVKLEAKRSKEECDDAVRAGQKKISDLRNELSGLTSRLDKFSGKKDKFVKDTFPELEEQLVKLAREIELVEQDSLDMEFEVADHGSPVNTLDHHTRSTTASGSSSARGHRHFHPPAPIGSQRPSHQTVGSKALSMSSAHSVIRSSRHGASSSHPSSILSSTAPPSEPPARLGHRFNNTTINADLSDSGLSSTSSFPSSSSSSPSLGSFQQQQQQPITSGQSNTYSIVPYPPPPPFNGIFGNNATGNNPNGLSVSSAAATTNGFVTRPVSPLRQASLPVFLPSHSQASHHRRSTVDGAA